MWQDKEGTKPAICEYVAKFVLKKYIYEIYYYYKKYNDRK